MKKTVSTSMYGLKSAIGISTSKPNIIEMRVNDKVIIEAQMLRTLSKEERNNPKSGDLVGFELVAVYKEEEVVDPDEQEDLPLGIDELQMKFVGCESCSNNPIDDREFCSLNCIHNSHSGSEGAENLFEPIPRSQGL